MLHYGLSWLWMCILAFSIGQVHGQSCALSGAVYDATTGRGLESAVVALEDRSKAVFTDDQGHFYLKGLACADSCTLGIYLIGYVSARVRVWPQSGRVPAVKLVPAPASEQKAVEITSARLTTSQTTGQSVATLDAKAMSALQGLPLADQLAAIPGVATLHTGPTLAKPVIHGLYGHRILILQNGVRLEGQQWGADHAPELDPYGAGRLQVVRGASALRFGSDAVGGVILADALSLPTQKEVKGKANLAAFSNGRAGAGSLLLEGGAGGRLIGLGWRVQGSGRRAGYVRAPDYYLDNTSGQEASYSAALGYTRGRSEVELYHSSFSTRIGLFSGASVGSVADLEQALLRRSPAVQPSFSYRLGRPYQQVLHRLWRAKGRYHFSDRTSLDIIYGIQTDRRREYDYIALSNRTTPELDLSLNTQSVTAELHHHLLPGLSGVAGLQGITQGNIWAGQFLIPNYRSYAGGAFVTERYQWQNLALEAGARLDYKQLNAYFLNTNDLTTYSRIRTFSRPSVSLGAEYTGLPITLNANFSSAWRAPSANELYSNGVHQSAVSFERGNAELRTEVAYNLSLTAALDRGPVKAEVTGYLNRMDGYIYLQPDMVPVRTIRGAFPSFSYRQTDALLAGFDAQASWSLGQGISLRHKSAFLWAHDRRSGAYLVFIPANRLEHTLRYEPKGTLSRIAPYFQASVLTVLRQNRVPADGDYAVPPAGYTLLGAEAGLTLERPRGKELSLIVTLTNALATPYRDYLNRYRYFTDEAGRNLAMRLSLTI